MIFMPSSTIGVMVSTMGETKSNSEFLALLLFLDIETPEGLKAQIKMNI
jgi:hypothetical protein